MSVWQELADKNSAKLTLTGMYSSHRMATPILPADPANQTFSARRREVMKMT
jgi:hypothetical protein